ncbi:hypothetical protein DFS34DRAFT_609590 [Phlyctochytrium arcticum]|nr:hypothetical protein DFS34DRAFT_609590 [Phlyctochytrium arcticum]
MNKCFASPLYNQLHHQRSRLIFQKPNVNNQNDPILYPCHQKSALSAFESLEPPVPSELFPPLLPGPASLLAAAMDADDGTSVEPRSSGPPMKKSCKLSTNGSPRSPPPPPPPPDMTLELLIQSCSESSPSIFSRSKSSASVTPADGRGNSEPVVNPDSGCEESTEVDGGGAGEGTGCGVANFGAVLEAGAGGGLVATGVTFVGSGTGGAGITEVTVGLVFCGGRSSAWSVGTGCLSRVGCMWLLLLLRGWRLLRH